MTVAAMGESLAELTAENEQTAIVRFIPLNPRDGAEVAFPKNSGASEAPGFLVANFYHDQALRRSSGTGFGAVF